MEKKRTVKSNKFRGNFIDLSIFYLMCFLYSY